MSTWWKSALVLFATLPAVAYVAGTLSSSPNDPAPRETIVIRDAEPSESSRPSPRRSPQTPPPTEPTRSQTADVEEVTPVPEEVDDDDPGEDDDPGPAGDDGDDGHDDMGDDDSGDDSGEETDDDD